MEESFLWDDPASAGVPAPRVARPKEPAIFDRRLAVRVQALAMSGATDEAIQNVTKLSPRAVAQCLAQVLDAQDLGELRKANWLNATIHMFPESLELTSYRDVQQAQIAVRAKMAISQADSVTSLRQQLIKKAQGMLASGQAERWQDVISGLRVLGVPQAPSAAQSPGHVTIYAAGQAGTRQSEYVYNEFGELIRNPAYDKETASALAQAVGIGALTINLADIRAGYAEANPVDATSVVLNPNNEIVGVSTGAQQTSLTNMSVEALRLYANPNAVAEDVAETATALNYKLQDTVDQASAEAIEQALLDQFD